MEEVLVTVFIPVFNAIEYIEETVNSVINQSYENFEILIVNDGSTDGTIELISQFNDPRIRIIDNGVNKGLPYTRNLGLSMSKGEYIAFLDADDVAAPERIFKQVLFLNENKNIDIVFSNMDIIGKRKLNIKKSMNEFQIKYKLLFRNVIGNSSVMLRSESVKKFEMHYNLDFFVAQDYRFWIDCIAKFNFGYISETLVYYRHRDTNVTNQSYKDEKKSKKRRILINQVHEKGLNNLNIFLSKQELALFNDIFNESRYAKNRTLPNIKKIYFLLKDDKILNNVNKIEWNRVLNEEIMLVISDSKELTISDIRYIFWKIMKNKNTSLYLRYIKVTSLRLFAK